MSHMSNIVKLGTDRGSREGQGGSKGSGFVARSLNSTSDISSTSKLLQLFYTFLRYALEEENIEEKNTVDFVVLILAWDLWVPWYTLWCAAGIPDILGFGVCTHSQKLPDMISLVVVTGVHSQKLPDGRTHPITCVHRHVSLSYVFSLVFLIIPNSLIFLPFPISPCFQNMCLYKNMLSDQ